MTFFSNFRRYSPPSRCLCLENRFLSHSRNRARHFCAFKHRLLASIDIDEPIGWFSEINNPRSRGIASLRNICPWKRSEPAGVLHARRRRGWPRQARRLMVYNQRCLIPYVLLLRCQNAWVVVYELLGQSYCVFLPILVTKNVAL